MPRVTHVKRAQQRYHTKPVIDPETGAQKRTPMMRRDGTQKMSKRGPVFLRLTERDLSRPKPLLTCDHCHKDIEIGTPYKWIAPKSGPYGGRKLNRHAGCPTWNPWEYSNSLDARISQIQSAFAEKFAQVEDPEALNDALSNAAEMARELAEEKRESASNIEDGFGHATYQSDELNELADNLDSWADDIESVDVPDIEDHQCEECDGTGEVECGECAGSGEHPDVATANCPECIGSGQVECENCGGDADWYDKEAWLEAIDTQVVDDGPMT